VIIGGFFCVFENAFTGKPAPTVSKVFTNFVSDAIFLGARLLAKRPLQPHHLLGLDKSNEGRVSNRQFRVNFQRC
jgi:hypothetical protein